MVMDWEQAIEYWRQLPEAERRRRRLAAIPRHVALSMAVEGEPVDEALIRAQLEVRLGVQLDCSTPPGTSKPRSES